MWLVLHSLETYMYMCHIIILMQPWVELPTVTWCCAFAWLSSLPEILTINQNDHFKEIPSFKNPLSCRYFSHYIMRPKYVNLEIIDIWVLLIDSSYFFLQSSASVKYFPASDMSVCYVCSDGVVSSGQWSWHQPAKRLRSHASLLCLQVMSPDILL